GWTARNVRLARPCGRRLRVAHASHHGDGDADYRHCRHPGRESISSRWQSVKVMKVLVTGSAGFIGSRVARQLLHRGEEVVGVDNLNDYYDPALKRARLAGLEGCGHYTHVHGD